MAWDGIVIHSAAPTDTPAGRELTLTSYQLCIEWIQVSRPGRNVEGKLKICNGRRFPKDTHHQRLWAVAQGGLVHICLAADLTGAEPPRGMKGRCTDLVLSLCHRHGIPPDLIRSHDEIAGVLGNGWPCYRPAGCPGRYFDILKFRRTIEKEIARRADVSEAGRTQAWYAPGWEPTRVGELHG